MRAIAGRWAAAGAAGITLGLFPAGAPDSTAAKGVATAPEVVPWASLFARCGTWARRQERYEWPLRPFDRQHPVRSFFGDPRTQLKNLTQTAQGAAGSFSFHNGIDIAGAPGQDVFAVVSGIVKLRGRDELTVRTPDKRIFQYFHLAARVTDGEHVIAKRTVLGTIRTPWDHVHFAEIRHGCIVNPLAPGHIAPYRDTTTPQVLAIDAQQAIDAPSDSGLRSRGVQLTVVAVDTPPLPVAGSWDGLPVTPAFISWRLTSGRGRIVVPRRTVVDFRVTLPPNQDFWLVYAPGSHEAAVVGNRPPLRRIAGLYLFRLTTQPLRLPPGRYRVQVSAADTAGNTSTRSQTITVTARSLRTARNHRQTASTPS